MTLQELQDKFKAKQEALAAVFKEAKNDEGQYDFNKVTCLGADVKGSIAVAEKVDQMNAELNEIGEGLEKVREAEQAAKDQARREKDVKRPPFPGAGADGIPGGGSHAKSIGELVMEDGEYAKWVKRGCPGGIDFSFEKALPSEVLAKGMAFETIGNKALFETTAGWAPESIRLPGFVEATARPVQLLDILPMAQTGQEAIKYMEETTRTHAAAETAEGGTFQESGFAFTEQTSAVRKITDSVPVTDEQLEDVAQAQSYLSGRITFGLRQRADGQCLAGSGTGSPTQLRGIKNVVGIQSQAKGADPVPDTFFKAMTKIMLTGRAMPTHHIMHPTDWQGVRLLRTADGVYIWGNPSEAGPERMWGLPVVKNDADAAGTGYTGSFQPAWISLFERRGVDIQIGYTGDQFVQGKRTIRGDMRLALVVFRPAAFCKNTGL